MTDDGEESNPTGKGRIIMFPMQETMTHEDKSFRSLWLAVIHQAMLDMVSDSASDILKAEIRRWFFLQSDSFDFVCEMAGLTPESVRSRARLIEKNPDLLGNPHV